MYKCGFSSLVTEAQYETIISSPDAWQIVNDDGEQVGQDNELRPTISARRIKVLVEQVTGAYLYVQNEANVLICYHLKISRQIQSSPSIPS